MKNIRLQYHINTGIRIDPKINFIQNDDHLSDLYDYINWLEDQLDKPIGIQHVNAVETAERLRLALLKL